MTNQSYWTLDINRNFFEYIILQFDFVKTRKQSSPINTLARYMLIRFDIQIRAPLTTTNFKHQRQYYPPHFTSILITYYSFFNCFKLSRDSI